MNNPYVDMVHEHHSKCSAGSCIPVACPEIKTIHYSNLPETPINHALCREWNTYRSEVARLLANGNEGQWVLIKEQSIIGVFHSMAEAESKVEKLEWPFLIRRIVEHEPVLRIRGYSLPWPNSILPLAKPA